MDPDIKLCSQLCNLSYDNTIDSNVTKVFKQIGLDVHDAQFTKDGNSVSFSYDNAGRLFIAWRGTKTFINFLEDINIDDEVLLINKDKYGKVHGGMLNYYNAIKTKVLDQVSHHVKNPNTPNDVVFSGYSLGACVCFAALESCIMFPDLKIKVITFASPLLGDQQFVSSFNTNIANNTRIVLDADAIPRLRYDNFRHVDGELLIQSGIRFSWLLVLIGLLQMTFRINSSDNLVKYHDLTMYMKYIG